VSNILCIGEINKYLFMSHISPLKNKPASHWFGLQILVVASVVMMLEVVELAGAGGEEMVELIKVVAVAGRAAAEVSFVMRHRATRERLIIGNARISMVSIASRVVRIG